MPDGSGRSGLKLKRRRSSYQTRYSTGRLPGVLPARTHNTMSVYVRGMGWVDIKPWSPK